MGIDFPHVMGLIAMAVLVVGKVPYISSIMKGHTQPSRTSWWTWTLLGGLSFATYLFSGETGTLWVIGALVVGPLIIAILSIRYGVGGLSKLDRVIWLGCSGAILLWATTGSAHLAHFFNLGVDSLATVPTVRKSWRKPDSENLTAWVFSLCGYVLNLFAIEDWTLFGAAYPVYLLLMAVAIVGAILWGKRRKRIQ